MFSQTFVDGARHTNKPYTIFLSTLMQVSAVCALILGSILYTRSLPETQLKAFLIAPPPPPAVVKPATRSETRTRATARLFEATKLVAPAAIPKTIPSVVGAPSAPDLGSGGDAPDPASFPNFSLFASTEPASPPPIPKPAKPNVGAVRVGGSVAEANIVKKIQPVYPALAKAARVQGEVEFTAVISKEGRVENLQLVRGHPLLVNAAKSAILQWRYRPTLLNGKPMEVMTTITVKFMLAP